MRLSSIFICHNLITVYKTMAFIKEFLIADPLIIYYDKSIALPNNVVGAINQKYRIKVCNYENRNDTSLKRYLYSKKSLQKIKRLITKESKLHDKIDLYVYLDHWDIIPSVLEYFSNRVENSGKITLLEEGLGVYSSYSNISESHLIIKKILLRLLGISNYFLSNITIGMHPLIDRVYCSNPEKLQAVGKSKCNNIQFEGNLINKMNSLEFLSLFGFDALQIEENFNGYRYVFLTQPMTSILREEKLKKLIQSVIDILSSNCRVLIKKHPRDYLDYSFLISDRVRLCPEEYNVIPFECFFPLVENARLVTFNSSVCNNVTPCVQSVFLYKLLNNAQFTQYCNSIDFDDSKIIVVDSLEEISEIVRNDQDEQYITR